MLAASWVPWIALQAKRDGGVLRLITLETRRKTYWRRIAAILAGISEPTRIRTGFLTDEETERYEAALDWMADLPIEVMSNEDDLTDAQAMVPGASGVTYQTIEQFLWPEDTYWWLVDHIGLVYDPQTRNLTDKLVNLSMQFARFSHSRVGGMVITHLTRSSVGGGKPTIDNLANSDQLTKDGDEILLLDRPYRHARRLDENDMAYLERIGGDPASLEFVSRDDAGGIDFMIWSKSRASFYELEEQPMGHIMPRPGEETTPDARG
jgi:hypothetical protein